MAIYPSNGHAHCRFETDLHAFHPCLDLLPSIEGYHLTKVKRMANCGDLKVNFCRVSPQRLGCETAMAMRVEKRTLEEARASEPQDRLAFYNGIPSGENVLTEIGVLLKMSSLPHRCRYLVNLIDVASDGAHTVVMLEPWDSDDIFSITCSGQLSSASLGNYMRQLLLATRHLHSKNIGHRSISLEALRVKEGELRLACFGQAVQLSSRAGPLRYFRPCGSRYYRAPECYVPAARSLMAPCPANYEAGSVVAVRQGGFLAEVRFAEGAAPAELSLCEPCGFEAAPVDVFACGVVLAVLQARRAPWRSAVFGDCGFAEFCRAGIGAFASEELLAGGGEDLLAGLLHPRPAGRISLERALASPWLDGSKEVKRMPPADL